MLSQVEGHLRLPDHKTKAWVTKGTLLITLPWFPQEDPEELQLSNIQGHSDTVPSISSQSLPREQSKSGVSRGKEGQELGCFPFCPHPDPQLGKLVCQQMVAPAAEGRGHLCCRLVGCGLTKRVSSFFFEKSLKRL